MVMTMVYMRLCGSWHGSNDKISLECLATGITKRYHPGELRLTCDDGYQFEVVDRIAQALRRDGVTFQTVDGVRVDDDDGWWLIRASNTQSIIVAV